MRKLMTVNQTIVIFPPYTQTVIDFILYGGAYHS